ncbi:MAG TPA: phosphatase PAP2 family protein [Pelobium sp.]|nr:phosphatase PAP2 family protein [Pelobium sp.]
MNVKIITYSFLFLFSLSANTFSQEKLSNVSQTNVYNFSKPIALGLSNNISKFTPLALTFYGFVATQTNPLKHINYEFQEEILEHHPTFRTHFDDYLQYTPLIATFTLKLSGNSGINNFKKTLVLFGTSTLLMAGSVYALKKTVRELRPDDTDRNSFPSGHTATAFAGAELLHQEFKTLLLYFSYSGYLAASATGALRMYNNKHYFSDVLAGAGIGILSTKAAYWLNDKLFKGKH